MFWSSKHGSPSSYRKSCDEAALVSERVRDRLKDILLGPAQLYEALRARSNLGDAAQP